jgi:hypothetical protein
MKDLGEASYVLGIEIHRDRKNGVLGLSQKIDVGASKIQAAIMMDGLQRVCPPNPFRG